MSRVLVFGPYGQVGWEMVRALQGFGECITIGRERANFEAPDSVSRAVRDLRPDWVINCVAFTQVDRAEDELDRATRINEVSVRALAGACADVRARLVHFSTDYVFDGHSPEPYGEFDNTAPLSVYGKSKLGGELAIRSGGCAHLIIRTSWVYAARGRNFFQTMLQLARERQELRVVDDQIGAPTWARFIAQATAAVLWRCRTRPEAAASIEAGSILNITSAGSTTWHGFATALLDAAAARANWPRPTVVAVPTSAYPTRARRPANSRLDLTSLAQEWEIEAPDWRYSMALCIEEALANVPVA